MEIESIKTVPLAEETVLWFEFLLKPQLLDKHVTNETKAVEIMSEFLNITSAENSHQNNEVSSPDSDSLNKLECLPIKLGRKQLALKILALKVASFIDWNLSVVEKNLQIQKQVQLLSDLCSITSGRVVNLPLSLVHEVPVASDGNKNALSFALTLYHRWILRAQVLKGFAIKSKPYAMMVQTPDQPNGNPDEKFIQGLEPFTTTSIEFLNGIIADNEPFRMLTYDSFVPLEETSFTKNEPFNGQKFDKFVIISKTELKTQIYFDLCTYYIFVKKYDLAKEMAQLCKTNLEKLKVECKGKMEELRFCKVTADDLKGYLQACGIFDYHKPSLFQRFNECLYNGRKNLEAILIEDNYKMEIPLAHRKCIETSLDKNSNEFNRVAALNCVRYILDDSNILTSNLTFFMLKSETQKIQLLKFCVQFSNEIFPHVTLSGQNKIKKFLIEFFTQTPSIEDSIKDSKYLTKSEIETIKRELIVDQNHPLSGVAIQADWIIPTDTKIQEIRVRDWERKLVATTNTKLMRKYLVELAKMNPQNPLWSINRNWYLPPEIRVVVLNLKRGFLQDFSYILLGKVNEMVQRKDFTTALSLITELRNEVKRTEFAADNVVNKLGKLIDWEKMNIQIMLRMDTWTKKNAINSKDPWTTKLNQMAKTINSDMPRLEIIENVMLTLLNNNEYDMCTNFDLKRSVIIELCVAFAKTMIDVNNDVKATNQIPRKREFWDLILPIFNISNQQQNANPKRNQQNRRSSDSPARFACGINVSVLKQFLDKMRDEKVITMQLSMLAKMHNLLKDDANMELSIDSLYLWPLSISNVNGYNVKSVSEALMQLLKLGLKLYPCHVAWVKLQGDLEFVNGNNEAAMKYYVQSLVISTEYCSLPIKRPYVDDNVIRKMIKCSSNLGCFLQSAVLCQFMDEIDYTLAFKCLQEKTSNFQDAMDSYYSLIWDTTLLEYIIHLHSKKNEHKRKLQAISYIKQLELNANNSEEVKQRASAIRKIKFVRSLANQYL